MMGFLQQRRFVCRALVVFACALTSACSHQDRMKPVIDAYEAGNYPRATDALVPLLKDRRDSEKDRTIYELEAGAIYATSAPTPM